MSISTSIDIDGSPETVWQVLTDFKKYPEWNPYMRIKGEPVEGTKLEVGPGPESGRAPKFRPRVKKVEPGRELRWLGHLFVSGLFDGEHRFVIEELDDGKSRLTQSEEFRGVLMRPILRLYGKKTEKNFNGMNAALKERVESLVSERITEDTIVN